MENKRYELLLRWLIRFGTKGISAEDIRSEFNREEISLLACMKHKENYAITVKHDDGNKVVHTLGQYGLEYIKTKEDGNEVWVDT